MFFLSIINSNRYSNQSERSVTQLPENSKCLFFGQAVFQASPLVSANRTDLFNKLFPPKITVPVSDAAATTVEDTDITDEHGVLYHDEVNEKTTENVELNQCNETNPINIDCDQSRDSGTALSLRLRKMIQVSQRLFKNFLLRFFQLRHRWPKNPCFLP